MDNTALTIATDFRTVNFSSFSNTEKIKAATNPMLVSGTTRLASPSESVVVSSQTMANTLG